MWYAVGMESESELGTSWISSFGIRQSDSLSIKYVASIYWTIATVMSVGYGDVSATNNLERMFSIFSQIVGAAIFGTILVTASAFALKFACLLWLTAPLASASL